MRLRQRTLPGLVLAAFVALSGCADPETELAKGVEIKPSGHARLVNLTSKPVAANLNALTMGQPVPYKGNTAFIATPLNRDSKLDFRWGDADQVDVTFQADSEGTITVYVTEEQGAAKHVAYAGDPRQTEPGKAAIRFVNLTNDSSARAKADAVDLVRDTTVAIDPGRYTVTATVMGKSLAVEAQAMDDGEAYTVVVFRNAQGEPDIALLRNNLPMILLAPTGSSAAG